MNIRILLALIFTVLWVYKLTKTEKGLYILMYIFLIAGTYFLIFFTEL